MSINILAIIGIFFIFYNTYNFAIKTIRKRMNRYNIKQKMEYMDAKVSDLSKKIDAYYQILDSKKLDK